MNISNQNNFLNRDLLFFFLNECVKTEDSKKNSEVFQAFKKASKDKDPYLIGKLGYFYETGFGTRKNMRKAIECYIEAASLGDIFSLIKIGDFYWDENDFFDQDHIEAFENYHEALRLSKENEDLWNAPLIYERIARCLSFGEGTQFDPQGAATFYEYAILGYQDRIEQGDLSCEQSLQVCEDSLSEVESFLEELEAEQQTELQDSSQPLVS